MDKATIVKRVAFRLGNVRGMDTLIEAEVDATINRLENEDFRPWFLLSENNTYKTTIGERRVPVPREFLSEYEDTALYVVHDGLDYPLQKMSQEEARVKWQGSQGVPQAYALTNKYFRLFPAPDAEYELELIFYRRSGALANDENPWFVEAADWVIYDTAAHMLLARKDKRYMEMEQLSQEQKALVMRRHTEREETNREVIFGG